jgi:hypothetical protein
MLPTSSARQLAERIFADEAGAAKGAEEAASAVKRIHEKLASALSPVVGTAGFKAMFARTIQTAKPAHPWLQDDGAADPEAFLDRLWARLKTQEPAAIRALGVALLSGLLALLSKFIGSELTLRLLLSTWPEAIASAIASVETS